MTDRILVYKIFTTLEQADLGWYSWCWWGIKDDFFKNYEPEYIDQVAHEMAQMGIIEENENGSGFRRKRKSLKEKIFLKIWG